MTFAKPAFDVGVQLRAADDTDLEAVLAFWRDRVGVPADEMLPLGNGRRQYRHGLGDSVIKLNHVRDGTPNGSATGLQRLRIVQPGTDATRVLEDPEGNIVECLAAPVDATPHLEMLLAASTPSSSADFYQHALGLERLAPEGSDEILLCGASRLRIQNATAAAPTEPELTGPGYRYLTIQVSDCDTAHIHALEHGGREGMGPTTWGDVARISFVRDPDGNWIEISQRRSLVGNLQPGSPG